MRVDMRGDQVYGALAHYPCADCAILPECESQGCTATNAAIYCDAVCFLQNGCSLNGLMEQEMLWNSEAVLGWDRLRLRAHCCTPIPSGLTASSRATRADRGGLIGCERSSCGQLYQPAVGDSSRNDHCRPSFLNQRSSPASGTWRFRP